MKPARRLRLAACLIMAVSGSNAAAGPGFATRDLNPVLQPIFFPGYSNLTEEQGWRVDHSLYITNTAQRKSSANESVVIDVENYRYELALGYRRDEWVWQLRMPYLANRGGEFDQLIENWHDLFGFPEGERKKLPRDQVKIEYVRDGVVEYSQTESSSGIGDVSIAVGKHPAGEVGYFVGIELPTGSESDFTGNEGIDVALWLLGDTKLGEASKLYGLFGVTFPADDGALEGLVVDRIWVAQAGLNHRFNDRVLGFTQLDLHSSTIDDSSLVAFGHSLQIQAGLGFDGLIENHRLDLFFSEDIDVGTAPDITFSLRVARTF